MEVDLVHRTAVGLGLRLGDATIHCPDLLQDGDGKGQAVEDGLDVRDVGVGMPVAMAVVMQMAMVVAVFVIMLMAVSVSVFVIMPMPMAVVVGVVVVVMAFQQLVLLQSTHRDRHMGAGNAHGLGCPGGHRHLGQAQGIHGF